MQTGLLSDPSSRTIQPALSKESLHVFFRTISITYLEKINESVKASMQPLIVTYLYLQGTSGDAAEIFLAVL